MESAALIAYANARNRPIVSFAQVTNSMAVQEGDFEKGESGGSTDALQLITATIRAWNA
jgi:uridine phosphorylase